MGLLRPGCYGENRLLYVYYPQQIILSSVMERKQGITLGFYFQVFTDLPRLITSFEVPYWVLKQVKTLICLYELYKYYYVVKK